MPLYFVQTEETEDQTILSHIVASDRVEACVECTQRTFGDDCRVLFVHQLSSALHALLGSFRHGDKDEPRFFSRTEEEALLEMIEQQANDVAKTATANPIFLSSEGLTECDRSFDDLLQECREQHHPFRLFIGESEVRDLVRLHVGDAMDHVRYSIRMQHSGQN